MSRGADRRGWGVAWIGLLLLGFVPLALGVEPGDGEAPGPEMSYLQAALLGAVEGLTEYIPVSSTGHLLVAQRAMGLKDGAGARSYAIAIQAGAILAVLGLYRSRIRRILSGFTRTADPEGRRLGLCLLAAFAPAAVLALLAQRWIKQNLFGLRPIVAAWILGGAAILAVSARRGRRGAGPFCGRLEDLTFRQAWLIGLAQCAALWPGVSRSLATLAGGMLVGLRLPVAVEFSFLLGLLTLGAATAYEAAASGRQIFEAYGWARPLLGMVAAYGFAVVSVRWMLRFLQTHGLGAFGWYRIALGVAVAALAWRGLL